MAQQRPALATVFRRGAGFVWHTYGQLDDPTLAGQTKPKYVVLLNQSPADDPFVYLLATSAKPKHANLFSMFTVPKGSHSFFSETTLLPVGTAGTTDVDRDTFSRLYDAGDIDCVGHLDVATTKALITAIKECPAVSRRYKQTLDPPA